MILAFSRTSEACRSGRLSANRRTQRPGSTFTVIYSRPSRHDCRLATYRHSRGHGADRAIEYAGARLAIRNRLQRFSDLDFDWSIAPTIGPGGEVAFYAAVAPATPY